MLLEGDGWEVIGRLAIGIVYLVDYVLLKQTEYQKETEEGKQAPIEADKIEVELVGKFFEYGVGSAVNKYKEQSNNGRYNE